MLDILYVLVDSSCFYWYLNYTITNFKPDLRFSTLYLYYTIIIIVNLSVKVTNNNLVFCFKKLALETL